MALDDEQFETFADRITEIMSGAVNPAADEMSTSAEQTDHAATQLYESADSVEKMDAADSALQRVDLAAPVEESQQRLVDLFWQNLREPKVSDEVVSQVLRGVSTRDRQIFNEEGVYRAYLLVEMPIGRAAAELMRKLQPRDARLPLFWVGHERACCGYR